MAGISEGSYQCAVYGGLEKWMNLLRFYWSRSDVKGQEMVLQKKLWIILKMQHKAWNKMVCHMRKHWQQQ